MLVSGSVYMTLEGPVAITTSPETYQGKSTLIKESN